MHDPAYIEFLRRLTPSERLMITFAMTEAQWEVLRELPPEFVQRWINRHHDEPWNPPPQRTQEEPPLHG